MAEERVTVLMCITLPNWLTFGLRDGPFSEDYLHTLSVQDCSEGPNDSMESWNQTAEYVLLFPITDEDSFHQPNAVLFWFACWTIGFTTKIERGRRTESICILCQKGSEWACCWSSLVVWALSSKQFWDEARWNKGLWYLLNKSKPLLHLFCPLWSSVSSTVSWLGLLTFDFSYKPLALAPDALWRLACY